MTWFLTEDGSVTNVWANAISTCSIDVIVLLRMPPVQPAQTQELSVTIVELFTIEKEKYGDEDNLQ